MPWIAIALPHWNQVRITLESEAVLGIINLCEAGQTEILSSEALLYEGEQSSLAIRREHTLAVLSKAKNVIVVTEQEKLRAANLMTFGIRPLDALHVALQDLTIRHCVLLAYHLLTCASVVVALLPLVCGTL